MGQEFRLWMRIADQAGIQTLFGDLHTLLRHQGPYVFLRIGQLISHDHFTICQSHLRKHPSDLTDILTSRGQQESLLMTHHSCRKMVQLLAVHAYNGGILIAFSHPGRQRNHR